MQLEYGFPCVKFLDKRKLKIIHIDYEVRLLTDVFFCEFKFEQEHKP